MTNATTRNECKINIQRLQKETAGNLIEIGKWLKKAQATFPRGPNNSRRGWAEWLKTNVRMSEKHAFKFIQVGTKFGSRLVPGGTNWKIASDTLRFLAQDNVPQAARDEAVSRLDRGEEITHREAIRLRDSFERGGAVTRRQLRAMGDHFGEARDDLPSPREARRLARETNSLVLARDNNYYTPATDEQIEVAERVRNLVFGVRRAVETLAGMPVTPHQFLNQAPDHLLWVGDEESGLVTKAARWITALAAAWEPMEEEVRERLRQRRERRREERSRA